jgi:hypothetical protein
MCLTLSVACVGSTPRCGRAECHCQIFSDAFGPFSAHSTILAHQHQYTTRSPIIRGSWDVFSTRLEKIVDILNSRSVIGCLCLNSLCCELLFPFRFLPHTCFFLFYFSSPPTHVFALPMGSADPRHPREV